QKLQQLLAGPRAPTDAPEGGLVRLAVGASEALHKRCGALRWLVQNYPIHVANINTQLERAGGDAQRLGPTLKLALDLLALTRLEIAVVQVGGRLQSPLVIQQRKEAVATAATVGKQQQFAMAKTLHEVVDQGD